MDLQEMQKFGKFNSVRKDSTKNRSIVDFNFSMDFQMILGQINNGFLENYVNFVLTNKTDIKKNGH